MLVELVTNLSAGRGRSVFVLKLELVEGWVVVQLKWSRAVASGDSRMASALAGLLVADVAGGATDVAITRFASEQASAEKIKCSVNALFALAALHVLFATALAGFRVAGIQGANGSVNKAIALFAAVGV